MKHGTIITIAACTMLFTTACQKNNDTPVEPSKVTTTIASPTEGQTIHKGDTVNIVADISYITRLHGYVVEVVNQNNNAVVFTTEDHEHNDHFNVNTTWVDTLAEAAPLLLRITAEITHDGDTAVQQRLFKSQP